MKKLFLLPVILITYLSLFSQNQDTTLQSAFDEFFSEIDTSYLVTGLLFDKTIGIFDLSRIAGDPDTVIGNKDFYRIYRQLHNMAFDKTGLEKQNCLEFKNTLQFT